LLTARSTILILAAVFLLIVGVFYAVSASVYLLGISLLALLFIEYAIFAVRYRRTADRIEVNRVLLQSGRVVPAVWAGTKFTVRVTITSHGSARLPYVLLEDRPPEAYTTSDNARTLDLRPGVPEVVEYELQSQGPGILRFEGVQVRVSDLMGFFYHRFFLREPVEYLVLPPLTDGEGKHRGIKRFNSLPPPGVHRLRRAGSGSELLDLRDYRAGDPPKMIAWKASARRDKLIVKELENDVPVRCVLFLDASNGARIGPPENSPLVRMADVAAGVAQAAAADRDIVGLTVFDDEAAEVTQPARTRIHMIRMLRKLAEAAGRLPDPGPTDPDLLARYAHPVAQHLYPELIARSVNSRPLGLFWIPIADSRWFLLVLALLFAPALLFRSEGIEIVAQAVTTLGEPSWSPFRKLLLAIGIVAFPLILAGLIWFLHGVRGFLAPRSVRTSKRKQLGALFATMDSDTPAAVERYLADDSFFGARATRFLTEHRVRLPLILHDANGQYRFRSEAKVAVLANALTRAVGRARDNELYVIFADLTEVADSLEPLIKAAKVARARHNRVLVIIPWPADVPVEPSLEPEKPGVKLGSLVRSVLVARQQRGFKAVRSALAKSGASVVRFEDGDPVQLVLDRLDRIRGVRVRR